MVDKSPVAVLTLAYGAGESTVIANGSASYARQGTLRRWRYDFGDGSEPVTGSGFPPVVSYTYDSNDDAVRATVTLYVEDNKGRMGLTRATLPAIDPVPPNQPPDGVLTLITAGFVSDPVQISTEGTTDPDNDSILGTIDWDDGTTEDLNPGVLIYEHNYVAPGTYNIRLSVRDNRGALDPTDAVISVIVAPDPIDPPDPPDPDPLPDITPPVAVLTFVSGQFATEPFTYSTEGSYDIGGTLASGKMTWGGLSTPTEWTTPLPSTLTHTYATPGTYRLRYEVTDTGGLTSFIERDVVVQAKPVIVNTPPIASISLQSGHYVGDAFVYALAASDPDGTVGFWSFKKSTSATAQGGAGAPPSTLTVGYTADEVGSQVASLTVTDNDGAVRVVTAVITVLAVPVPPPPISGDHAWFDMLVARPSHFISYSARNATQIATYRKGTRQDVTYTFPNDPDPRQQDGAKVVIPAFVSSGVVLLQPLLIGQTTMQHGSGLSSASGLAYKIDNEIVIYVSKVNNNGVYTTTILRGQHGTTPADHGVGSVISVGVNSLQSQVRFPLNLTAGASYFLSWEGWYGGETKRTISGLTAWKTFQLSQGASGDGTLGLEVRNRFDGGQNPNTVLGPGDLATVDMRAYLDIPDGSTAPIQPQLDVFIIKPETWTRYLMELNMVPDVDGYYRLSLWVLDATRLPMQLLDNVRWKNDSARIAKFWLEYNTSRNELEPGRGTLVNYFRNLAVLRNDPDVPALIGDETPPPASGTYMVVETFTTDVDAELSTWVSDNGATWHINEQTGYGIPGVVTDASSPQNSTLWKVARGRDWISPMSSPVGERTSYYIAPPGSITYSANYSLEMPLTNAAANQGAFAWIMLRRTAFDTFYGFGYYRYTANPDGFIFKRVNGVNTILAQGNVDFTGDHQDPATQSMIRAQIRGDHLEFFKDDVLVLEAFDGTITAPGFPGLGMGDLINPTDRMDSAWASIGLTVVDLGA